MKKIVFFLLFLSVAGHMRAQTREADSLRQVLKGPLPDSTRVWLLAELSFYMENVDSCLKIDYEALDLARSINYSKGEAKCLNQLGNDFWNAANYPKALEYYFQSLQINEQNGDLAGSSANYANIANIYSMQEDFPTALNYAYKSIAIRQKTGIRLRYSWLILGNIYEKMNRPDSALASYSRAYELFNATSDKYQLSGVLSGLGNVHAMMKHPDLAFAFYRMSIEASPPGAEDFPKSYYGMATVFEGLGKIDSSLSYAKKAIATATAWPETYIRAALLLSRLYEGKDDSQSFFYYKKAIQAKDSIYASAKQLSIKNMTYNEQERQREIETAAMKAKAERKHNLQYSAIALGLVVLIIGFLLISQTIIVNEKFIRFLGIVLLLLVFEFINLFIHPYLAYISKGSPYFLLLVLVVVAALLAPLHNRGEKWILHRLVEKNKRIRLAAAQKTIARLGKAKGRRV